MLMEAVKAVTRNRGDPPRSANFYVRKAAVLGTGVMGLRIAAHLANADVPVVLFGRGGVDADPKERIRKAIDGLRKIDASAFVNRDRSAYVDVATYEHAVSPGRWGLPSAPGGDHNVPTAGTVHSLPQDLSWSGPPPPCLSSA